ncbi:MAG: hypothetical protein ACODAG_09220, partial [Myxococcota bacterium]
MRFRCLILLVMLVASSLSAGCASSPVTALRFHNRAPVWSVQDRKPIPKPEERTTYGLAAFYEHTVRLPVWHALELPEPVKAKNINSLGEVPDSTWFQNRIGRSPLTPREVGHGNVERPPKPPFVVVQAKISGGAPGFLIEDAREERYLLKFDFPGLPEVETGPEAAIARLMWAAGYNVPQNTVVHVRGDQFVLASDAIRQSSTGREEPMTDKDLERTLAGVERTLDGEAYRAVVSKFLDGVPIDGYPMEGVREGDPNDRVPHEHRRDVRGLWGFYAWVGNTDVKENNTLDVWMEHPEGSGRGYLVHHILDFSKGFSAKPAPYDGWARDFDWHYSMASAASLGLWRRPWERIERVEMRGVAGFEAEHFQPDHFRTARAYRPFLYRDRFDAYWATKILVQFTRAHVEAAVAQGRYGDPRAASHLLDTLMERRRKMASHWFAEVNPVDRVRVRPAGEGFELCAEDLLLTHGVEDAADRTTYALQGFDYDGRPMGYEHHL